MTIADDLSEVISVVRDGKCVTIRGEEAERFQQQGDKHLKWVRRTGGGTEPAPFVLLRRNAYVHRKYVKLSVDSIQTCSCLHRPGKHGCYDNSCLLRAENVECTPGFCPCGDDCQNQRFQRCQNAPTQVLCAFSLPPSVRPSHPPSHPLSVPPCLLPCPKTPLSPHCTHAHAHTF